MSSSVYRQQQQHPPQRQHPQQAPQIAPAATTGTKAASILSTLNAAQCRAVTSSNPVLAILAGPGSGKTHTLTSRVVWLLDHVGYAPCDVVVATFTVKAAREMKERIGRALGGEGRERNIVLGTFHSIARRYLATYGTRIGLDKAFGIADDGDSRSIINRICQRFKLTCDPAMARGWISKRKSKGEDEEERVRTHKAKKNTSDIAAAQDLETCFAEYQAHLATSNLLDYDDLLVRCVELLQRFPSCVSNIQAVLVDEYQDTNGIQYKLMRLFAQKHQRITVVGDPDQSIYGWRSAEIKNLYRLLDEYPKADQVALEENYRSSSSILSLSLQVIQQDEGRYKKVLLPIHDKCTRPVLRRLKTMSNEADWVVSEIRRITVVCGNLLAHDDFAILLRSASLSRHIESELGKSGIPYKMVGGRKFYERAEIKVLIDYLRVIHQPDNNDAFVRVMNVPRRGIGDATVKPLLEECEKGGMSLWDLLLKHCRGERLIKANLKKSIELKINGELIRFIGSIRRRLDEPTGEKSPSIVDMIQQVLTHIKFEQYLQDQYPQEHEQRWANVQEFVTLASDFVRDQSQIEEALPEIEGVDQVNETDLLGRFLANVSLASDAQTGDKGEGGKPMVTISTIHAAKGLEWPVVFIPAAYEGSIPHSRSEDSDEERRLLYVAMTRAKALLYLSCSTLSAKQENATLSRFLSSIPENQFAKKGPSFQRQTLTALGSILQREVPSDSAIYMEMPLQFNIEDDKYPTDPLQSVDKARERSNGYKNFGSDASRVKRARKYSNEFGNDKLAEQQWRKEYSTTMEKSSDFTISSLPGFVTAGAHKMAIAAVEALAPPPEDKTPKIQKQTTKRPVGQTSLLGFVKTDSKQLSGTTMAALATSGSNVFLAARNQDNVLQNRLVANQLASAAAAASQAPSIDPALAGHRLGGVKRPFRPAPHVSPDRGPGLPKRQHSSISGSPQKTSSGGAFIPAKVNHEGEADASEMGPTRPASILHTTTQSIGQGTLGIKRPASLGRLAGMAPLDRLRKPFKPLTMNRQ